MAWVQAWISGAFLSGVVHVIVGWSRIRVSPGLLIFSRHQGTNLVPGRYRN